MKSALGFLVVLAATPLAAFAETKIAVVPVGAAESDQQMSVLITDIITTEAGKRTDLKVIGSNELKNLVSFEQQKALAGCSADSCLAEVGAALGVDAILSGSLGKLGDTYVLNLTLMDTHKAQPLSRSSEKASKPDQFLDLIPFMVGTLLAVYPGGPPPPPRPSATAAAAPGNNAQPAGNNAQQNGAAAAQGGDTKKDEGGGSSMFRRIAGLGIAGAGVVMLLVAGAVGVGSLGFMVATRVMNVGGLNNTPVRYANYGIGGVADVVGIVAFIILLSGVVVAVIP